MTDHTAIIERMARAMCEAQGFKWEDLTDFRRSPGGGDDERGYYLHAAQVALTASGLLEVLEKAEPFDRFGKVLIEKFPSNGGHTLNGGTPEAVEITPADFAALRNAIKGVRDGATT